MSGNQTGIVPLSPEQAAQLPGPAVDLPQIPAPPAPDTAVEEPSQPGVIEVTRARPDEAPAPEPRADEPPPPVPEPPAPQQPEPTAEPTPGARTVAGPRGTVAAVPQEPIVEARGLLDLLRRGGRVLPDTMPAPRPQDFVELGRRQIAIRAATADELDQVATELGRQTPDQIRLISTRGGYMPTDVQEFVSAVRLANENLFEEMRRGVQRRDRQIQLAERLGLDGVAEQLLRRRPGETLNNEGLIAGSLALINARRETAAAEQALRAAVPGSPEEAQALVQFGLNHAMTAAIAAQLNGAAAEAGRALGALRFVQDAIAAVPPSAAGQVGPEGLRVPANASPESIIEALGGSEAIRAQAAVWAILPDEATRTRFAQRSVGQRMTDAVVSAYVNSLLWLPTTHMRNILGTTTMGLWSVPERFLGGAIGAVRSRLPWTSDERVYMGEAFAQLYGMWAGFGEGLSAAGRAFRENQSVSPYSRLELPRSNAISAEAMQLSGTAGAAVDILGTVLTMPGRMLVTEDSFFQAIGTRMEFLAQVVRTRNDLIRTGMSEADASREAMRLLQHPPEQWRDAAEAAARAMTFQDEMTGALGMLADVMRHPVAKLYVPFFNTPTNVARAVINRSPVALVIPGQAWADIRAGGARADMAMARIALGSMVMWWFSGLVMNTNGSEDFRITGSAPTDPARREGFQRQGLQPFSFCTRSGGQWTCRSFAGADPLSGLMAMAADTANYTLDHPDGGDGEGLDEIAMGGAFGLYEYMLQMPFLQGVSELARTLSDPRLESGERFRRSIESVSQRATEAITSPLTFGTLGTGLERAIDPTQRSTMPTDPETAQSGPIVRGFYTAMRRAQGRIPGASGEMEPRLNLWGEEVRPTEGGLWELFWPIRTTTGQTDALEETLYRLGGVLAMPGRRFPQTNVELTAGQFNAMIRIMNRADDTGMTMRQEMLDLVQSPDFIGSQPAEQMEMLRRIRTRRWRVAQQEVMGADGDLNARVTRDREVREITGRSPRADMPALQ